MQEYDVSRAIVAAKSTASTLGLTVDDVVILQNANRLVIRLMPCDVLVRIAPLTNQVAQFEMTSRRIVRNPGLIIK